MRTPHNRLIRTLSAFKRTECFHGLIGVGFVLVILGIIILLSYITYLIFPNNCNTYINCMPIYVFASIIELITLIVLSITMHNIFYCLRNSYRELYLEYTSIDDSNDSNPDP
jgi:hypothetical protein